MRESLTNLELAEIAGRRSSTWWLLSRLVMEQPQEPWLVELEAVLTAVDPAAATALGSECGALLLALRAARNQHNRLTALAIDRTRLLAGIMQDVALSPPFESAALGVPMNSDLVSDVIECYREAGMEDFSRELGPPDFLGTELRFMAALAYREMQAYQDSDLGLASLWLSRQQHFLDRHLLSWLPKHCERLGAAAMTPFYAALGLLLGQACQLDRDDIRQLAGSLNQGLVKSAMTGALCAELTV